MLRFAFCIALAAAAMLLFLSLWIIVPPVAYLPYPVAVGSPEISPILLSGSVVILLITARHVRRSNIARLTLVFAAIAALLSVVPIVQLLFALPGFNLAMAATTADPAPLIRGDVKVTRGVLFSKADGVPLTLDVYQPPSTGTFPIVMQIYGGSWQNGAPASHDWFSRHLAARGYLVVAIDYRHAPEWIWPEQIVDVRTALYWISNEAPKFGGDPSHIVLAGQSAGAQLAMRLAYQEGPSSIRGVVNYYGPVDLAEGWRRPPRPDPANVRGVLETFIGGTPSLKPEHYRHASPITWVTNTSAPTLSIYGARDHVVDARFGRMLDTALKKAGATSVLIELPWSEHSFDAVPGLGRWIALYYTERFMAWAVKR